MTLSLNFHLYLVFDSSLLPITLSEVFCKMLTFTNWCYQITYLKKEKVNFTLVLKYLMKSCNAILKLYILTTTTPNIFEYIILITQKIAGLVYRAA